MAKINLNIKNILKLNGLYLILQLLFFLMSYGGVFDNFLENCYGSLACNMDLVLWLQLIINLIFVFIARKMFNYLGDYLSRFINILLSSLLMFILFNYFLYETSYKPTYLFELTVTNIPALLFLLLLSLDFGKYLKTKFFLPPSGR